MIKMILKKVLPKSLTKIVRLIRVVPPMFADYLYDLITYVKWSATIDPNHSKSTI